jgi:hypothetical protein
MEKYLFPESAFQDSLYSGQCIGIFLGSLVELSVVNIQFEFVVFLPVYNHIYENGDLDFLMTLKSKRT